MKRKPVKETDKTAFFGLLKRSAQPPGEPRPPEGERTSEDQSADDCSDSKTRSRSSEGASEKPDGKSH